MNGITIPAAAGATASAQITRHLIQQVSAASGETASAAIVLAHRIIMDVAAKSGATASAQDIIHTVEKEVAASGDTASVKVIQTLKEQVSAASGATVSPAGVVTYGMRYITIDGQTYDTETCPPITKTTVFPPSANLYSYPQLVKLTVPVYNLDGSDIRFTDMFNNLLYHELMSFSQGVGMWWVNIPVIPQGGTASIRCYYGAPAQTQHNRAWQANTWDQYYAAVYHFSQNGVLSLTDATANGNDLTNVGGCTNTSVVNTSLWTLIKAYRGGAYTALLNITAKAPGPQYSASTFQCIAGNNPGNDLAVSNIYIDATGNISVAVNGDYGGTEQSDGANLADAVANVYGPGAGLFTFTVTGSALSVGIPVQAAQYLGHPNNPNTNDGAGWNSAVTLGCGLLGLQLTEAGQYLTAPSSSSLSITGNELTLECHALMFQSGNPDLLYVMVSKFTPITSYGENIGYYGYLLGLTELAINNSPYLLLGPGSPSGTANEYSTMGQLSVQELPAISPLKYLTSVNNGGTMATYFNGVAASEDISDTAGQGTATMAADPSALYIGGNPTSWNTTTFLGLLFETRISSIARSQAYVTYTNQILNDAQGGMTLGTPLIIAGQAAAGATASATIITHLRQLVTAESGAVAAEQAIKRLHLAEQAEAGGTAMATLAECLKFAVQVSAGANAGATWTFGTSIKHLVFAVMACEGSAERSVGYFDDNIIFINVDTTTLIPHQHHHHEQCLWPDIVVEFEVDDLPQGFEYEEVSSGASAGAEVIVN
jgi:hypothetical protein